MPALVNHSEAKKELYIILQRLLQTPEHVEGVRQSNLHLLRTENLLIDSLPELVRAQIDKQLTGLERKDSVMQMAARIQLGIPY